MRTNSVLRGNVGLEDLPKPERLRFKEILKHCPQAAGRVLDIGSARHESARRELASLHEVLIQHVDGHVVGVDVIEPEVTDMQMAGHDVRLGNMEYLSKVIDDPVDIIVAGEVIEHVMNPGRALKSCAEVLKPGGSLILSTPNPDGFSYWRKAMFGQTGNLTHTCWIDPFNLRRLIAMTDCGLRVNEVSFLSPVGGISSVLWRLGFHRASSPGYVAELRYEPPELQ